MSPDDDYQASLVEALRAEFLCEGVGSLPALSRLLETFQPDVLLVDPGRIEPGLLLAELPEPRTRGVVVVADDCVQGADVAIRRGASLDAVVQAIRQTYEAARRIEDG